MPRIAGHQALDQPPEPRAVVHFGEMRHLMRHDIIDDVIRGKDQPPAERQIAFGRAAAPAALRVAHADPRNLVAEPLGKCPGTAGEFVTRQRRQMSRTRRGRCVGSPRTRISPSATTTGGAAMSGEWRMRWGIPSTGTMAPSTNGIGRGNAESRLAIQPRLSRSSRRPNSAGTPRGNTSSTRRQAASMRRQTRRARELTRIASGAPRSSATARRPISASADSAADRIRPDETPRRPTICLIPARSAHPGSGVVTKAFPTPP